MGALEEAGILDDPPGVDDPGPLEEAGGVDDEEGGFTGGVDDDDEVGSQQQSGRPGHPPHPEGQPFVAG